ncbi:hypothetical protein G6732_00050 [Polynucleobacter paneuropaeus]|nr:hypothetical protein [Polynucleobacter paneuropaeus]
MKANFSKTSLNFGELFLCIFLFSIFSIFIINYYIYGDRIVYEQLYSDISSYSLVGAVRHYYEIFSSPDIVWLITAYLFSSASLNFDFYSIIISICVFCGLLRMGVKYIKYRPLFKIYIPTLFLNIQFLTLYFSSQRLGIAICLLCFSLTSDKFFSRIFLALMSILSHFTVCFFFIISFFKSIKHLKIYSSGIFLIFFLPVFFILAWFFFGELIIDKTLHYSGNSHGESSINYLKYTPVPFIVYFVNRQNSDLIVNCSIFLLLIVFNDERVFQLGYLYATWSIFTSNSCRAAVVALAFNIIPMVRGVEYIAGVFLYGNGLDPNNFGWITL